MAKYLIQGSYTLEGVKGIAKEGGTARVAAASKAVESLGGNVDAMYFALGSDNLVAIMDVPDNESAAALSLTVAAAGGAALRTTVLLTAAEMDQAAKRSVSYTPPGR